LLGLIFSYADIAIGISGSAKWTGVVLVTGLFIGIFPIFGRKQSLHSLIITIAVCAAFSGWMASFRAIGGNDIQRRFQRAFWRIQAGMTRGEVEASMHQEFPDILPKSRWDEARGWYCLGNIDNNYDAEIIVISMKNGRVVSTSYFAD